MNQSNMGAAVGLLVWGVLFLVFCKWVAMSGLLAGAFNLVGFVFLLIGAMGLCIELGKGT